MTKRPAGMAHRGFSLVEMLVAIVILAVVMTAMVPVFVLATKQNGADAARNIALNIAQDRIEKIRQLDFDDITYENLTDDGFYGGQFDPEYPDPRGGKIYDIAYLVQNVGSTPTSKQVSVTVTWLGPPTPVKAVQLRTVVYRQWAGPQIVAVLLNNPPPTSPPVAAWIPDAFVDQFLNEQWITGSTPITINVFINPSDVPTGVDRTVYVSLSITGPGGTQVLLGQKLHSANELYSYVWTPPADDGMYAISATAFSVDVSTTKESQGNTVTTRVRRETSPPDPVTGLVAGGGQIGGSGQAMITWDPSTATDFSFYEVRRNGLVVASELDRQTNAYTDAGDSGPTYGSLTTYEVYAVDETYRYSEAASVECDWTAASIMPQPPTSLTKTTSGSIVVLSWQPPLDASRVTGYQVFQDTGSEPIATVTGLSYSFDQGYSTTKHYQVRSINRVEFAVSGWSTVPVDQPTILVGAQPWPWLLVAIGPEPLFNISIRNNTNRKFDEVYLYYNGPSGNSGMTPVAGPLALSRGTASSPVMGQHAGYYTVTYLVKNQPLVTLTFQITPTMSPDYEFPIG